MEFKVVRLVETTKMGQPVVIQGVPAKVCPNCGEQVFFTTRCENLAGYPDGRARA